MNESNDGNDRNVNEPEIKDEEEERQRKNKQNEEEEGEEEENIAVIPPNGGWGWLVVLSAFYCNVVVDGIQLTFGIFLKAISKDFHAEYSEVALAGSLMFGVHLLMGPVCSGCNSVFGLRPVTITGCLICSFGVGISYFANGYWCLYFTFGIIGGVGLGLVYMNTLVITSLYFTTLMPVAIAIVVCGTGIGTMVFAGLGSFLLQKTTWQNSFLMQAALASSMSIAAIAFKPLKPVRVKLMKEKETTGGGSPEEHQASSSKRRSVFIKTEMPAEGSMISVYQNLALSFAEVEEEGNKKRKNCCPCSKCCRKRKTVPKDVNFVLLKEIHSEGVPSRRKSYVETTTWNEAEEEEEIPMAETQHSVMSHKTVYTRVEMKQKKASNKCWETIKKTIIIMLDYRLLSSCSFFIFTVSGAITLAAFLNVFIFEKDRCEDLGFSEHTADHFIIALGAVNVFWRLLLGGIAIIPKIRHWVLAITGMVIGGVATMVSGYSSNVYFQVAFCFVFGLAMACFAVFRMPLLIDLVGTEFLENAAGINLLFMGIFCIAFPPFFGWLKEATHSYNVIFIITGSLLVISALMLIKLKKVDISKIKERNIIVESRHKFHNKN